MVSFTQVQCDSFQVLVSILALIARLVAGTLVLFVRWTSPSGHWSFGTHSFGHPLITTCSTDGSASFIPIDVDPLKF